MPFLRQVEVIVGSETQANSIKDLRIVCDVQKSRITYPNKAKISIYNLKESTRNAIKKEFTKILVNAGYTGAVSLLFKGDIKNVYHRIDGVDTVTEIYAADGDIAWQESVVNYSAAATQSLKDTVISVASTLTDVTIGNLLGLNQGKISNQTVTYSGATRYALDQLGETYQFDWCVQNNIFETVPKNGSATDSNVATIISAKTGMVGSPTVTNIGVDVTCFLNPALLPNRWVFIESSGSDVSIGDPYFRPNTRTTIAQGFYIIYQVEHVFDNRGPDALTTLKCRAPGISNVEEIKL